VPERPKEEAPRSDARHHRRATPEELERERRMKEDIERDRRTRGDESRPGPVSQRGTEY